MVRKIRDLVSAGAVVIAPRPEPSPSLADYPKGDEEIRFIANQVWGPIDGKSVTEHAYGKGKVYWGRPVGDALRAENTPPDFEYNRPEIDSKLVWIHRKTEDADIYFVSNQRDREEDVRGSFRVDGKEPELWHADTGDTSPAAYQLENGRTLVPLHLDPYGSVFVVLRHKADAPSRSLPQVTRTELTALTGPWELHFPPNWGAPTQVQLNKLSSWTRSTDPGVKYFSGTATYAKDIDVPAAWLGTGAKLVLDLGEVKDIAEVSVNGKPLGEILWKPPYRVEIGSALKPGTNHLEIKITNLWTNRVIGDHQPGQKRYTFTDFKPMNLTKDSELLESGLLGPVRVLSVATP